MFNVLFLLERDRQRENAEFVRRVHAVYVINKVTWKLFYPRAMKVEFYYLTPNLERVVYFTLLPLKPVV